MSISTAVPANAVARTVGIKSTFKNLRKGQTQLLPQRVAVVGQGASLSVYSNDKQQVTSAQQVGELYGFGSPVHLASKQLFPVNGDGVGTIPVTIYPLDDDGSGVVSDGDITPGGAAGAAAAYQVVVNNIASESFVTVVGDTVAQIVTKMTAAINAVLDMPIIAVDGTTAVTFTSKWEGTSANDIFVEVVSTSSDVTYVITQANGGLVNPDVDDATAQIGEVWETLVISCLNIADTASLDKFSVFGEGRWGALTRKPLIVFTGQTEAVVATAITIPDARTTDRTNSLIVAPGSNDLPLVVAAAGVSRIAVLADGNPPHDYGSLDLPFLTPGTDAEQWDFVDRDLAIKSGTSSSQVKDGVVNLSDTVTFYHPSGETVPAYRYAVDIVKLQNIIYNTDLIFNTPEWDGAPLIPDGQATSNRTAKKPSTAKAALAALIDSLALEAIISDPETAKASILAEIDAGNPKRLNLVFTVQLVGNTNIISIDLDFGFLFGTSQVVA